MNPSSFIKDIGRSFFVSSFLPASLFVSVGILVLQDFLPKIAIDRVVSSPYLFGSEWLISLLLIAWVSFTLYSILPWTFNLFEGHYFPQFLQKILTFLLRKYWYAPRAKRIQQVLKLKDDLTQDLSPEKREECIYTFAVCRENAIDEYLNLEPYCSIEPELLLPTRLGNLLRACSYYPQKRYNINGDLLWPRLLGVLPKEFIEGKDDHEARLIFMLNSSLLAFGIALLCIIGGLCGVPCLHSYASNYCSTEFINRAFTTISPIGYMVIGALFGFLGYLLYLLAISAGKNFCTDYRTAFDLYRFDLLKMLHLEIPKTLNEERYLWDRINEIIMAGDDLGLLPVKIKYQT